MAEQIPVAFEFRAGQHFDGYYPGGNIEVLAHLQRCAQGSGEQQIFLWGGAGSGKSHLLQACSQQSHQHGLAAFYAALSISSYPSLLEGLERFDLVCLDDIDQVVGRAEWEMALFNFYNAHRGLAHKLIVSARCPPDRLGIQLPDLKTRLNWGLVLMLKPLDDADKIGALMVKAGQMGFNISPQVGKFLLSHFDRDLPSLWAMLDKLDKASLAAQRKLTIPFLKKILIT